jgi:putative transposase
MVAKPHATNIHDSVGAVATIEELRYSFPRLKKIIVDGGYRGKLANFVKNMGYKLTVVLHPNESSKKFQVVPLHWIVKRTFRGLKNYYRRMTIDYGYSTESAEAMLQISVKSY